jgi:WXG100 family type VII secretion target
MNDGTLTYLTGMIPISQSVVKLGNDMETLLNDLRNNLIKITATWTGQSKEQYSNFQRDWDDAATHLHYVLVQAGNLVGDSHEIASNADHGAGQLFVA